MAGGRLDSVELVRDMVNASDSGSVTSYITALLVASRLHGFSRNVKDVVRVVRICEPTIKKRYCTTVSSILIVV